LVKAAGVEVEPYWPSLFAGLAAKKNIEDFILNVGAGGGAPAAAAGGAAPAGGAAAAAKEEEKPAEEEEDAVSLTLSAVQPKRYDGNVRFKRYCVCCAGHGLLPLRLSALLWQTQMHLCGVRGVCV
jgi:large subunit ribosomal protein LP1